MPPAAPQTSVGADSISARGPRRIARLAGGACPSPTNHGKRPTKQDGLHHPGGRRAGCPHPAAPRGGTRRRFLKLPMCGGRERPPYRAGQTRRPTGKMHPRRAATPVGDDACIVPRTLRRRERPRADRKPAPAASGGVPQTNKQTKTGSPRGCRFCLQDGLNYSSILPNMAKSSPSSWMRWVVAGAWGLASGSRGASANSRAGTLDGRGPLP